MKTPKGMFLIRQLSNSTNTGDVHTPINVQNMHDAQQKSINKNVHNFANKR